MYKDESCEYLKTGTYKYIYELKGRHTDEGYRVENLKSGNYSKQLCLHLIQGLLLI